VAIVGAGLAFAFARTRNLYLAALVIGLGPLVRTTFIFVMLFAIGFAVALPSTRRAVFRWKLMRVALICTLAVLPIFGWAVRNYVACGRFPVLSSLEGEGLYGANNDATANDLRKWGYWVVPDEIPGEPSKAELAARFSTPLGLNDYYHQK